MSRTTRLHTVILGLGTRIIWSSGVFRNVIKQAGTFFQKDERSHVCAAGFTGHVLNNSALGKT